MSEENESRTFLSRNLWKAVEQNIIDMEEFNRIMGSDFSDEDRNSIVYDLYIKALKKQSKIDEWARRTNLSLSGSLNNQEIEKLVIASNKELAEIKCN